MYYIPTLCKELEMCIPELYKDTLEFVSNFHIPWYFWKSGVNSRAQDSLWNPGSMVQTSRSGGVSEVALREPLASSSSGEYSHSTVIFSSSH